MLGFQGRTKSPKSIDLSLHQGTLASEVQTPGRIYTALELASECVKDQIMATSPMENSVSFCTSIWTTSGMRSSEDSNTLTSAQATCRLLQRPGDSLSSENLRTLPESHQSHTAWFYTTAETCRATAVLFRF